MKSLPERKESLWWLIGSPSIWATHFMLCYITAAIWCAKVAGRDGSLGGARIAIVVYTVLALAGIGFIGRRGRRASKLGSGEVPFDADTPEDRHRFIGYSTFLLSLMSAVATVFGALVVIFFKDCR